MRGIVLLAAVLLALLAGTRASRAHAALLRSEPADRAVVAAAPRSVTLTFNEPVSPLVFRLLDPGGEATDLTGVTASGATIAVALPTGVSRGTHLVSWRVISADGHPVGGGLTFSVGQPIAAPPTQPIATPLTIGLLSAAIWLARVVLYVGLFVGVGGAFFGAWIAVGPQAGWTAAVVRAAQGCGILAALVSIGLQGADALGLPLSDIGELRIWKSGLATPYGVTLSIAVVALMLGLAATSGTRPRARLNSAVALVGTGAALAASGHAATAGPELATRSAVFLHGTSLAFWVGALLPLAAALRAPEGQSTLVRFSTAIPLPLAALVATGLALATVQVRQLDALWTTSYGVVLSGKLVAVAAVLALAAMNRRLTPRAAAGEACSTGRLVRSIRAELIIAAVILGLVACWRFTPPPRALLAAAAAPVRVHIHAANAMADLQIGPAGAEGRQIMISLLNGEFGPLAAKEVVLVLSKPDAGIEPLRLDAGRVDETTWRIDAVRLPVGGRWHAGVEILVNDFEKIMVEDDADLP
jgi:copper transport protein